MLDYKESSLTGRVWTRCFQVVVDNVLDTPPRITFQEERIYDVDDGSNLQMKVTQAGCGAEFSADESFPLIHPVTNEPLNQSMTHAQLQVAIYSLYKDTAIKRDIAMGLSAPAPE